MREPGDLNTISGWDRGELSLAFQLVFEINDAMPNGSFSALRAGLRPGVERSGFHDLGIVVSRARHVKR